MNAFVKAIGIIDNNNNNHLVKFNKGVNVITGKSSTGKSAIIEIFDYCFGSSQFTVPKGIITNNAQLYYTIFQFDNSFLLIARKEKSKGYIEEILNFSDNFLNNLKFENFNKNYFIPLIDFKNQLARYFGIDITHTDDNITKKEKKKNQNLLLEILLLSCYNIKI